MPAEVEPSGSRHPITRGHFMSALARNDYAAKSDGVEVFRGESGQGAEPSDHVEVRCECGTSNCTATIHISLDEYQVVRTQQTHFVIKEGHEVAEVVRVVGYGTEYVVVDALGQDTHSIIGGV
jgi:hypothetical protein